MTGVLIRAAGFAGVYLLVLTSIHPGDVATGALIGLAVAVALRPRAATSVGQAAPVSLRGAGAYLARTAGEVCVGSWRVVRFCLGAPAALGFVEIPREDRTPAEVAAWGVLTGEAPDEVPIDVDEERGVLIVHLVDASDPDAVRARHRRNHDRLRGRAGS
jgi:multisubunit Na+/H+ antiporter MnhE subunit